MSKLSLKDLESLRDKESQRLQKRDIHGKTCHIVVGMGTIGIEAGAKLVLNTLVDEAEQHGLKDVLVTQTGAFGKNENAPIVEVHTPETGSVAYGKVDVATAKRIITEHIMGGKVVADHKIVVEE